MKSCDISSGDVTDAHVTQSRDYVKAEISPVLGHRTRFLVRFSVLGQVLLGELCECRLGFKEITFGGRITRCFMAYNGAKEAQGLISRRVRCPRRTMFSDGVEALASVEPIFEDIDWITALASDSKSTNGRVPDRVRGQHTRDDSQCNFFARHCRTTHSDN